jgi:hypothetical protein
VSTGEFAATEMLEPLPDAPGPAPEGQPAGLEPAAGPGTLPDPSAPAPWAELHAQADANLAAVRARAGIAMEGIARDHEAALDRLGERPEIPQERPASDRGQPFDVTPGSFLAAASCPSCGYSLAGRPAVHVLAGRGAQRTAVAVHQDCSGEAL